MATIREVAERAGVSPTTVSHVINNTRFVSDNVRARVQTAMEALGYRPNALARSLRRGHTQTLGLILPDSSNPFFAEIGHEIELTAFEAGYSVILCNTEGDLDKEDVYIRVLTEKQVDGMIFVSAGEHPEAMPALLDMQLPVVVIDRDLPEIQLDTVLSDNRQGGYLATRHLLALGHTRIACLAGPSNLTPSAERVSGYRAALTEAHMSLDEALIVRGDFHPEGGWAGAQVLFQRPDPPTAIFACNDLMAIGVLRAAAEAGRRVPMDLALVGFDDIELATYTTPPLTTIAQPKEVIGRKAVQLLLEHIADKQLPPRREVLPTTLVVRKTCGNKQ